jgi:hypothetical protein
MIVGQNALLNQYVPTFYIKDIIDGQILKYDSVRKAFVNATGGGSGGVNKLGELLNVSPTVDSPNPTLHNGQGLVYNSLTSLWENAFVDYNTLLNVPTTLGTVTDFSFVTHDGVSGAVANSTSTPSLTLTLGNITPISVIASGTIRGSNFSAGSVVNGSFIGSSTGTNTGDQTITLTGDVTGSGTGSFATTLATVPIAKGGTGQTTANAAFNALAPSQTGNINKFLKTDGTNTFWAPGDGTGTVTSITVSGSSGRITSSGSPITTSGIITLDLATTTVVPGSYTSPNITIDSYGRITSAANGSVGSVTSVGGTGTVSGLTLSGTVTTTGSLTLGGTLSLTSGNVTTALGFTPYSNANPAGYTSNTGTVTSITAGTGLSGGTITTAGTIALTNTAVVAGAYTLANITVDAQGRITSASSGSAGAGTVTSVSGTGTVSGLTLSGTVNTSGNLTLGGTLSLTSGEIVTGLGYTPYSNANPAGYTSNTGTVTSVGLTGSADVTVTGTTPITSSGAFSLALSDTTVVAGVYTAANITIDSKGRITAAASGSGGGGGTVTSVGLTSPNSTLSVSGTITTAGSLSVDLPVITQTALGNFLKFGYDSYGRVTSNVAVGQSDIIAALGYTPYSNANPSGYTSNTGTVTSVGMSVPAFLSVTPSTVTTAGTFAVTLSGTALPIANGGTGATTADGAINALVPAQAGNIGRFLTTNGSVVSWGPDVGPGTVTSVAALTIGTTGTDVNSTVVDSTTTPVITLNIPTASSSNRGVLSSSDWTIFNNKTSNTGTVTSVGGTGTVSGLTLSGSVTTTGNLTLGGTLSLTSGDVTSALGFTPYSNANPSGYTSNTGTVTSITAGTGLSGGIITTTGTIALANTAVSAGSYTLASITVDAQGRITSASSGSAGAGSVTNVSVVTANGISGSVANSTTTPAITLTLGAISPTSVAASGTVTGSNLSGTNTGNQTITLTGAVTGTGTGTFATTYAGNLPVANLNSGTGASATTFWRGDGIWSTPIASATPAGNTTEIQFNNAGVFGATDNFKLQNLSSTRLLIGGGTGSLGAAITGSSNSTGILINAYDHPGPIGPGGTYGSGYVSLASGQDGNIPNFNAGDAIIAGGTRTSTNTAYGGQIQLTGAYDTGGGGVNLIGGGIKLLGGIGTGVTVGGSIDLQTGNTSLVSRLKIDNLGTWYLSGSAGTAGQVLTTNGTGALPTWTTNGTGTVTNVSVTGTTDITGTVATSSTTPAVSLSLTTTGVSLGTYGSATQVPVFTVDSKGRISGVTNTSIIAASTSPEIVVFHYSSGGSGNFTPVDAIFSQTSGVTATVTDGANCIATYAFTGKSNPPKSIMLYGQNFVANTFSIVGMPGYGAAAANIKIAGGGTSASPDLANGIFSASNIVTLQTRMADTGASSTIGNRAWLIVVFGF